MRRSLLALAALAGGCVVVALAAGPTAASPPPAGYGVPTLSIDSNCRFSATASWSHTKVDSVTLTVNVVGSISTNGMTTTIKGRTAVGTLQGGSAVTHTFNVTANFLRNGAVVDTETSTDVGADCAFGL